MSTAAGVFISLAASLVDALGINLLRRDHLRHAQPPLSALKTPLWKRPQWLIGFILYVGSQVVGSSLALQFLVPVVVAALGAASLVFNVGFAYFLVGTKITRLDYIGTFLVILGAVLVAVFGSQEVENLTLEQLVDLYERPAFIIYFSLELFFILCMFAFTAYVSWLSKSEERWRKVRILQEADKSSVRRLIGFGYAVCGGTLASQTVLLAGTVVLLIKTSFSGANQFYGATSFMLLLLLIVTGVTQVICMNSALKICSTVIVVPVFFSFYSILALLNSNMYFNRWNDYYAYEYVLIVLGILILVGGVYILSKSSEKAEAKDETMSISPTTASSDPSPDDRKNSIKIDIIIDNPAKDQLSSDGRESILSPISVKSDEPLLQTIGSPTLA